MQSWFTEILKEKIDNSKLSYYLEFIYSSGKSLLTLINDILDLSKVEAGKLEIEYTPVSIKDLFTEMELLFKQKTDEKNIGFIIDIPDDLPKALLLDEARLRQIMVNLVSNAVKFTENGSISLSVQHGFIVDKHSSKVNLSIWVTDTGMGMDDSEKDKIFDSFEQLKPVKTGAFGGTGLGLAISKRLVNIMNGEISVKSKINKGSSFLILFQGVAIASMGSDDSSSKRVNPVSVKFNKSTVLVADDIECNRQLLKIYLEKYNLSILEAEDGIHAIEMVREYKPDLILIDMKMPKMDGYEASSILKKDEKLKDIPIIVITASAMKQDEENILGLCEGYIRKPVSKTELVLEIMKFLPHTTSEDVYDENLSSYENDDKLSYEMMEQFPEVLKILKEKKKNCENLSSLMAIDEIETFASELKEIGEVNQCKPLIIWAEDLYMSAIQFDMVKIKKILQDLSGILNNY
jgi:CheY-like chemotaxis protein